MNIHLIKTESDYKQAFERLEVIFDAKKVTDEGDESELLGMLIDQYENEHFPIAFPDPIEAIKFRMEQMGFDQNDLARIVGFKRRTSEILCRKRKLSLEMISQLHNGLNISTDVLIQTYS